MMPLDRSGRYPRATDLDVRRVVIDDDEYPRLLRHIDKAPPELWVAGRDLGSMGPCVAVIGARRATQYGIDVAFRLAAGLAISGVCVVSGMARGVDAAAHAGALSVGGRTIAALGCGPDICYPSGSRDLYTRIASAGAIVSEHPPGTEVNRSYLLDRNRILVGMSYGVVVVQGDARSAAVATGRRAVDAGRELFAVPGSIDWPMSTGVHDLLRNGAHVCASADDVLKIVNGTLSAHGKPDPIPPDLPPDEARIWEALAGGSTDLDGAMRRAGLGIIAASRAAGSLEAKGLIRRVGSLLDRAR